MFAIGNLIRIKETHESRSGVTLPAGATGRVHFVPGQDWGQEMIVALDKPVAGPRQTHPRTFVLVKYDQAELISSN